MSIFRGFEYASERAGIITPGLPLMPPGVESYPIPGGGSRAVSIDKGDEITLLDREGLQVAELVFFTPDGSSDSAMLGAKGVGEIGLVPTASAVANAFFQFNGERQYELPLKQVK